MIRKLLSIFLDLFLGPIVKQPVSLSLNIVFINFPSFPPVESSKDFASVNLVKGLYSRAVISNFLKGNISLSIISSSILILIILLE